MQRREKFLADKEDRKPRKLLDSDYLLGVYDETRMGAIRFSLEAAQTKTLKQYGETVFMPSLAIRCSENTRTSY